MKKLLIILIAMMFVVPLQLGNAYAATTQLTLNPSNASADTYTGTHTAGTAFNGSLDTTSNGWYVYNVTPPTGGHWLQYDFGASTTAVNQITLYSILISQAYYGIKDFQFYASNDGTTWNMLTSGTQPNDGGAHTYPFSNTINYRYYKLTVLDSYYVGTSTDSTVGVTQLQMYAPQPPNSPTGLTATAGNSQVSLAWNAVTGVDGYNLYQNGTKVNTSLLTTTSFTVTGLTNGTSYSYQVSAVQSGLEGTKSNMVTVTPSAPPPSAPATPTGLQVLDGGGGTANVSWTANPSTDSAVGYNLYQNGVLVNKSGPITGTGATVTGLTIGSSYSYTLTAVNSAAVESSLTAPVMFTPANLLSVNYVPNKDSIVVNVTGGTPPYTVNWGSGSNTFSGTSYTINGLTASTNYTVTVTDSSGKTFTQTVNTGTLKSFVPPVMPNPVTLFQKMIDNFGGAGSIALAIITAAVSLGVIVILGLYGWRLTKRWLSASK